MLWAPRPCLSRRLCGVSLWLAGSSADQLGPAGWADLSGACRQTPAEEVVTCGTAVVCPRGVQEHQGAAEEREEPISPGLVPDVRGQGVDHVDKVEDEAAHEAEDLEAMVTPKAPLECRALLLVEILLRLRVHRRSLRFERKRVAQGRLGDRRSLLSGEHTVPTTDSVGVSMYGWRCRRINSENGRVRARRRAAQAPAQDTVR